MALTRSADKPVGGWTYDDLVALPDDGRRFELIDGELYELPTPNEKHQRSLARTIRLVLPQVEYLRGLWYPPPTGVFLPGGRMVEPDLVVLLPGGRWSLSERGIEGVPDLVIEILSSSNREHDLRDKRSWYAEAGVPEYWVMDPVAESIEVLVLRDGGYARHVFAQGDALVASAAHPSLSFAASRVFSPAL